MQSEMAKHTLQEIYLRRGFPKKPYVLALLTFHMIGMEPGLSYLREIKKDSICLCMTAEDSLLNHLQPGELIKAAGSDHWIPLGRLSEAIMEEIDVIFLPVLSFSLVNDILTHNEQRPFVRLILEALLKGKKVVALKTGADPYDPFWKLKGMDKGTALFKRKLYQQLIQLKSMGIDLITENEEVDFMAKGNSKSVITEEAVRLVHQRNLSELEIQRGSIITPLARDLAKELNILLKFF